MHFTYEPKIDSTSLKQGDVLKKTPELIKLLEEIHPHYAEDDYLYFQVVTQTCDLVRRNGGHCKSRYITIAAVRSLDLIIRRVIEDFTDKVAFKEQLFCSTKHKGMLVEFFKKLFNNNDSNHFFLKAAPENELYHDCCTQLHLSISIRAYEHYDVCLKAKRVELKENFRAKLGWMVGNLYSRVGTVDYVPTAIPNNSAFNAFIDEQMNGYVGWIEQGNYTKFKQKVNSANSIDEINEAISIEKNQLKEKQLVQLVSVISKSAVLDASQQEAIKNVLAQNPLIQKVLNNL